MRFLNGQTVVHPHHGPATVTGVDMRSVKGEPVAYLRLRVLHNDLVLGAPLDRAEEIGIRPLLHGEQLPEVFNELTGENGYEEREWSRRIKANVARLRSGEVLTVAGLVRDLTRRDHAKGVSAAEKALLKDARGPLVAELAIVLSLTEEQAEAVVEAAILEGAVPELPEVAPAA